MKTLRVVLSGLGRAGWKHHAPHIEDHPGLRFVAAADPLAERRLEAEQLFGIHTYADYTDMLDEEKPDLAVIASPTHLHREQAIAAFERGIDVFCDKPLASTLADADAIMAARQHNGRRLMVYQPRRVEPETRTIRKILDSGILGKPFLLKRGISEFVRRNDWQTQTRYGGGIVNNTGAHVVDQVICLFRKSVSRIDCHLRRVATLGDAEDVFKAFLELEDGMLVDIEINIACALPLQPWLLCGSCGAATLNAARDGFVVRYFNPDEAPCAALQEGIAASGRSYDNTAPLPWREEEFLFKDTPPESYYSACYDYYADDRAPLVPLEQTREVLRVLEVCRNSSK